MANFIAVSYDPWDNSVFDFIVFADEACAKSYARHWRSPFGGIAVSVSKTEYKYPLNKTIGPENRLYWKRFQAECDEYVAAQFRN